ncbi:hypothetical protein HDU76_000445 [Blyttiomyces sp. JEL0837]|nr:hypothetical protein HDU76_000445 [Blyttiomyces sp. JEL0837]
MKAWCILEILACDLGNGRFHVALSTKENQRLLNDLKDEYSYDGMLSRVNSERSNSTIVDDRDKIFEIIKILTSFSALDCLALKTYTAALIQRLEQHVAKLSQDAVSVIEVVETQLVLIRLKRAVSQFKDTKSLSQEVFDKCEKELGGDHPTTILALLALGQYELAETCTIDALERANNIFVADHILTMTISTRLFDIYIGHGKHGKAETALLGALEHSSRVLGDDHPITLNLANNLGHRYQETGRFDDAEHVLKDLLSRQQRIYGPDHFRTLRTVVAIGSLYDKLGQYEQSEILKLMRLNQFRIVKAHETFSDGWTRCREHLGDDFPETLRSQMMAAQTFGIRGEYDKSEEMFKDCIGRMEKAFGCDNIDTLVACRKWGEVLNLKG